jgi:hypothetical protein
MSDCSNKGIINTTFIIDGLPDDNNCNGIDTNKVISCSGNTSIDLSTNEILINGDLLPKYDDIINIGSENKRFRTINTVNGKSTVWVSTTKITTPELDLGEDSDNNIRIITADNSILKNDVINGGNY